MLTGLLAGVLTGWVLSLFDLHLTVIEFIQRFTDKHLTITCGKPIPSGEGWIAQ